MRFLKTKKLISCILVLTMAMASGLLVFADTGTESVDNIKGATLVRRGTAPIPTVTFRKHGNLKAAIEKLVEEGKLSKEKAEKIEQYMEQKREERKQLKEQDKKELLKNKKFGFLTDMVQAKIITNEDAEAIRGKFIELREKEFNEKLSKLVQQGTITSPQAEKVKIYFENARKERLEQVEKLQNMTAEQRVEFFKNNKKACVMKKLVEDGVINQQQAEELRKALREGHKN